MVKQFVNLTRQLLIFSSNQPMQISSLDLNGVITSMFDMLSRLISENIALKTDLAADLFYAQADKVSIEQLVMNLVINARDSMPNGGKILIRTENASNGPETDKFLCVTIEDDGDGMTKEV